MDIDRIKAAEILTEATRLITQDRANQHGESFKMTAQLWSAYLGIEISQEDFCICLALMKIARGKKGNKIKDHFLDGAAYVALAGSPHVKDKEPEKANPSMKLPTQHHPEGYIKDEGTT